MEKLINRIDNSYIILICVLFGMALILFPRALVVAVPYVMGCGLILYACADTAVTLRHKDGHRRFGKNLIWLAVGLVTLIQREESLNTLGVIWALLILQEVAEDLDVFWETRELHVVKLIWSVISLVLAVMLMHDPDEHFVFHMRVLGLEIIAYSMIRLNDRRKAG